MKGKVHTTWSPMMVLLARALAALLGQIVDRIRGRDHLLPSWKKIPGLDPSPRPQRDKVLLLHLLPFVQLRILQTSK